ncbi:PIN domain-containing protein [Dyadobacter pollutisoli]|jgi:hypothetical protein|uniref:PIN domain-containing protein n=1 Tax=Dyadobacter pollutisoli TaxID=2910158 RepID=A0A9E8NGN1_9BACT|nr:PIN domain-containing protein [Dyadobacter pollutisoli]WAC14616.1 PIN domain-containing protein [Dyadobacter pollutisoli]
MFTVLIDTSAFEKEGLSFSGSKFDAIKQFSDSDKIKIVSCSIIIKEIDKHIEDSIIKFINSIKSTVKEADHIAKADLDEFDYLLKDSKLLKKNMTTYRKKKVSDFFKSINKVNLSYKNFSIDRLLTDYFNEDPPFSQRKKNEFPDAIILNSFINQFWDSLDQTCVVSCDRDFKNFCQNFPQVRFFENISTFSDFINSHYDSEFTKELHEVMKTKIEDISLSIDTSVYDNVDFVFGSEWFDPEAEIEDGSVSVQINDISLIIQSENNAEWELDVEIGYKVHVTDSDPDYMVKDPDTKEWISLENLTYSAEVKKNISFAITTAFDKYAISSSFQYDEDFELPSDIYDLDDADFTQLEDATGSSEE